MRVVTIDGLEIAKAVIKVVRQYIGRKISIKTVRWALHCVDLKIQAKKKKPLLSTKNIKARLEFAKSHHYWTIEDWKWVIFIDEIKINCFCAEGHSWCLTSPSIRSNSRTVKLTIKHGGGSMMVWGCLTAIEPSLICNIDGRMNQFVYCDILESKLLSTFTKFGLNPTRITFQHDNDSKHIAKTVKEC